MGKIKDLWIGLKKKFIRREKFPHIGPGDGGAFTDKVLDITKPVGKDTTFIVNDSLVVAHPKK